MVESHTSSLVLVVDDEPLLLMDAVDILARRGFTTIEAKCTDEALQILAVRPDIKLLFTDVNMPPGRDGIDLVHEVRSRWPDVLLIVTSGDHANGSRPIPSNARFIVKPYEPTDLAGQIGDMIDGVAKQVG